LYDWRTTPQRNRPTHALMPTTQLDVGA
jgi:hypothetical protein